MTTHTIRNSFDELVLSQRACRRFDADEAVSDEDLQTMVTYAVHAPSANNWQPWEFVVVRDQETRHAFGALVREHWLSSGYQHMKGTVSEAHLASANDGIAGGGFDTAPVVVIVCVNHEKVPELWAAASIYPACQNLLLGAASLGYGSCFTTGLTTLMNKRVSQLLSLPENLVPMAGIFLGRPARALGRPNREPASTHMHREKFGGAW